MSNAVVAITGSRSVDVRRMSAHAVHSLSTPVRSARPAVMTSVGAFGFLNQVSSSHRR